MLALGCVAVSLHQHGRVGASSDRLLLMAALPLSASELGLIAFAAKSAGLTKLPVELTWMLNFGVAGAICNLLRRID